LLALIDNRPGAPLKSQREGIAMAVAVKNTPDTTSTRTPLNRLAVGSLVGVVYILGSVYLVLHALHYLWWDKEALYLDDGSFVNWSLLILAMLGLTAVLVYVGKWLAGPSPPHGLRAGIAVGLGLLLLDVLLIQAIGVTLENWFGSGVIPLAVSVVIAGGILFYTLRAYFRPGFEKWLGRLEDQGWFSATSYKVSQGQRVRKGTILAVLALAACGIYTMWRRGVLRGAWELEVPFLDKWLIVLLPETRWTLTVLLGAASIWLAWRLVNYPTFADFLIATEAEMNKVSWTTRRRLVQDTIVVLTTVFLLTIFLMVVDLLWIKILSNPLIKVIQIDTTSRTTDGGNEKVDW
jgi:preprotein translocase SecE subunit